MTPEQRERALHRQLDRQSRRVRELGFKLAAAERRQAATRAQIADEAHAQQERERLAVREAYLRGRVLGGGR